jgi:hypothetical protein
MARKQRSPSRTYPGWQADDPLGLVQDEFDDRPRPEAPPRPNRIRPGEHTQRPATPHIDFPACPPERTERTWRLVRLFVQTGEAYGRTRVVSPWLLGKELAAKINHDHDVLAFIAEYGQDLAEDILARMIRIYWRDYVDSGMSRTAIVNQFLDDYWSDLFDRAKTQYATDEFARLEAAGKLKTTPHRGFQSLMNDAEYQEALRDIAVDTKLQQQLMDRLNPEDPTGNPEATSKSGSGKVRGHGAGRRRNPQ